jgi:hypothetical protein
MPIEQVLTSPSGAVLGLIAVLLTVALAATLKALVNQRKSGNGNGNGHSNGNGKHETVEDRVTRNMAYIAREQVEMPGNWRRWVDERIDHKLSAERLRYGVIENLVRSGEYAAAAALVEKLDRGKDKGR